MCFYIYSSLSEINVKYASESITFSKGDKAEAIIDILLSNPSNKSINELNLIYPNRFYKVVSVPNKINSPFQYEQVGSYQDITKTMLDQNSKFNWVYRHTKYRLRSENVNDLLTKLEFSQPHPKNPRKKLCYEGLVGGEIEILPVESLTPIQWAILQSFKFTFFRATFNPPIDPGASRWCRWRFCGEKASISPKRENEWFLKFTNELTYNYQLFGPYDARNKLMEHLYVLNDQLEEYAAHMQIYDDLKNLISILEEAGITFPDDKKYTEMQRVIVDDWRIHINPHSLKRLTDILMQGDIAISGNLPNIFIEKDRVFPLYEWKTGRESINIDYPEKEFYFSINFQAKDTSRWTYILPFVGIITVFIVLIILFWMQD